MNSYYQMIKCKGLKQRISLVMMVVCLFFLILISRLFYLQVIEGEEYRKISENNYIRIQSIDAPRGLIFDRKGRIIVDNRPSYDLIITPKDAKPIEKTIENLSLCTGIPIEDIQKKISQPKRLSFKPILIQEDIDRDMLAIVEANKYQLPGVTINVRSKREYLNGIAPHLIGYLGEISPDQLKNSQYAGCLPGDYVGKFGIEKTYENILRGKRGGQQVEVTATGQVYKVLKTVHPQPGNNISLTIDFNLQEEAERLLEGRVGAVAAMNPFSGEMLAMASTPSFNPNLFVKKISHRDWRNLISNPFRPLENKVIQAEYPPASTYKVITAMAAIELGLVREKDYVFCPGYYEYNGRTYRCWKKGGHGYMNIFSAISNSCDVFFYHIGQKIGVDRLAAFAKQCGLGAQTGIPLDNESKGLVPSSDWKKRFLGEPWQQGETLSVSIGQSYNLTTPIQMLVLTAAIANGGTLYQPQVLSANNYKAKPIGELPINRRTLDIIRRGLWEVVNSSTGTARAIASDQLKIFGKTGTAQIIGRKSDEPTEIIDDKYKPHAWFIAYSEAYPIAVVVLVENGEHGSGTAAPIAKQLIEFYAKNCIL